MTANQTTCTAPQSQPQERIEKAPPDLPFSERLAYSPADFAKLFGRSATWGYRQLYAGRVKAITSFGRIMIPRSEVERVAQSGSVYTGVRKHESSNGFNATSSLNEKS